MKKLIEVDISFNKSFLFIHSHFSLNSVRYFVYSTQRAFCFIFASKDLFSSATFTFINLSINDAETLTLPHSILISFDITNFSNSDHFSTQIYAHIFPAAYSTL
ncbi:TPA: hypothetical protein DEG21_02890 [Patescibacteria group bacterium]|nr:hypothetical protein [Candidatus Gracilibacteria bacterium]HBY74817.1 hypothetical protein [Candidatus Gracilibacteria bacterium]